MTNAAIVVLIVLAVACYTASFWALLKKRDRLDRALTVCSALLWLAAMFLLYR